MTYIRNNYDLNARSVDALDCLFDQGEKLEELDTLTWMAVGDLYS